MTVKTKMVIVMRRRTVWIMVLKEGWLLSHWQMRGVARIGCDTVPVLKKGPRSGLGVQCTSARCQNGPSLLPLRGERLDIKRVTILSIVRFRNFQHTYLWALPK